ncbi:MAG: hypothetical protein AAGC60_14800 [Acidobacteriota bacterium]
MVQIAFVGTQYQDQMQANPEGLDGVEVTWNGQSVDELMRAEARPHVIAVDLDRLGDDPAAAVETLRRATSPELILVIYRFAKREILHSVQAQDTRVLQGPVSLASLRSQILGLLVRELFTDGGGTTPQTATCPHCGSRVPAEALAS